MFCLLKDREISYKRTRSLYNVATGSEHFLQRLKLDKKLNVHDGCVNTICWNDAGTLILSGSDDQHLAITDPFSGKSVVKFRSGHRSNIFSAKFLPGSIDREVVSCSGSGEIFYTDVDREDTYGTNRFDCHFGTTYKLLVVPNEAATFLSCGDDGTVRFFDLRMKTSCSKFNCEEDVVIHLRNAVTAMAVDPIIPFHLAVASSDGIVRLYDRRMLKTKETGANTESMICKFPPPMTAGEKRHYRITSLNYRQGSHDVLVNYSSENIYLFNTYEISKQQCFSAQAALAECVASGSREIRSAPNYSSAASTSAAVDSISDNESAFKPIKRLRLRGDWSDTGPDARPESEEPALTNTIMQRMSDLLTRMLNSRNERNENQDGNEEEAGANDHEEVVANDVSLELDTAEAYISDTEEVHLLHPVVIASPTQEATRSPLTTWHSISSEGLESNEYSSQELEIHLDIPGSPGEEANDTPNVKTVAASSVGSDYKTSNFTTSDLMNEGEISSASKTLVGEIEDSHSDQTCIGERVSCSSLAVESSELLAAKPVEDQEALVFSNNPSMPDSAKSNLLEEAQVLEVDIGHVLASRDFSGMNVASDVNSESNDSMSDQMSANHHAVKGQASNIVNQQSSRSKSATEDSSSELAPSITLSTPPANVVYHPESSLAQTHALSSNTSGIRNKRKEIRTWNSHTIVSPMPGEAITPRRTTSENSLLSYSPSLSETTVAIADRDLSGYEGNLSQQTLNDVSAISSMLSLSDSLGPIINEVTPTSLGSSNAAKNQPIVASPGTNVTMSWLDQMSRAESEHCIESRESSVSLQESTGKTPANSPDDNDPSKTSFSDLRRVISSPEGGQSTENKTQKQSLCDYCGNDLFFKNENLYPPSMITSSTGLCHQCYTDNQPSSSKAIKSIDSFKMKLESHAMKSNLDQEDTSRTESYQSIPVDQSEEAGSQSPPVGQSEEAGSQSPPVDQSEEAGSQSPPVDQSEEAGSQSPPVVDQSEEAGSQSPVGKQSKGKGKGKSSLKARKTNSKAEKFAPYNSGKMRISPVSSVLANHPLPVTPCPSLETSSGPSPSSSLIAMMGSEEFPDRYEVKESTGTVIARQSELTCPRDTEDDVDTVAEEDEGQDRPPHALYRLPSLKSCSQGFERQRRVGYSLPPTGSFQLHSDDEDEEGSEDDGSSRTRSRLKSNKEDISKAALKIQELYRKKREARELARMMEVPQPRMLMKYSGHRNCRTMIKEANFYGDKYIISGSDCGRIMAWERETGRMVMYLDADRHVVNCVQPNPNLPIIASSGIDYDIKIWSPLEEDAQFDAEKAEMIIHRNELMLEETRDTVTVPAAFMLRILASLSQIRTGRNNVRGQQPAPDA